MLKSIKKAKLFDESISDEEFKAASEHFTLHRLPFGTYLIKDGEIPKALYYLLKGTVRKQLQLAENN